MVWLCWIRETRPVEGFVAHAIVADTHDEAVEKARQLFAGTRHAWATIEVEPEPISARAA